MRPRLKPIHKQVMVITGASSGIGLETARTAAKQGAKVVLVARSEHALNELAREICESGGDAIAVACDVAQRDQVEQVAKAAVDPFGRIDTWLNNAGTSIYGRLYELSERDGRRLFDTNFWGG